VKFTGSESREPAKCAQKAPASKREARSLSENASVSFDKLAESVFGIGNAPSVSEDEFVRDLPLVLSNNKARWNAENLAKVLMMRYGIGGHEVTRITDIGREFAIGPDAANRAVMIAVRMARKFYVIQNPR
jgi:hypothetical protein